MEPDGPMPPMAASDEAIAAEIDGGTWVARKLDAMRAHATQITPDGDFFKATPVIGDAMWSHEYYLLAAGRPFPDPTTWSDDVFAGLDVAD